MSTMSVIDNSMEFPNSAQTPEIPAGSGPWTKASNHWSVLDRDNIFNRRASGEGWETICRDYPERTRHALHQQYSMMKKQRDKANGTFIPRRRGRKTKSTPRRSWASVNKRPVSSDEEDDPELEDEDEDEEVVDERLAVEGDESPATLAELAQVEGYRPLNPLIRNGVGCSPRFPFKSTLFPNLPLPSELHDVTLPPRPGPAEALNKSSAETEGTGSEYRSSPHPNKRRKYSTEPSETSELITHSRDSPSCLKTQADEIFTRDMILSAEDVAALQRLLTKAHARARSTHIAVDAEKESRQATYEAALGRANRRAHNAEENLRLITQESGDKTRAAEEATREYGDKLRAAEEANREYGDKLRAAEEALNKADQEMSGLRRAHADSLKAKDDQRSSDIAAMESELQAWAERSKVATSKNEMLEVEATMREEQLKLYDKEVHKIQTLEAPAREKSEQFQTQFDTLSASIEEFNGAVDDIPAKKIKCYAGKIQDEKEEVAKALGEVQNLWTQKSEAISAFGAQFLQESLETRAKDVKNAKDANVRKQEPKVLN